MEEKIIPTLPIEPERFVPVTRMERRLKRRCDQGLSAGQDLKNKMERLSPVVSQSAET
jgi:hypothetical protein